jgi:hypothetical protein
MGCLVILQANGIAVICDRAGLRATAGLCGGGRVSAFLQSICSGFAELFCRHRADSLQSAASSISHDESKDRFTEYRMNRFPAGPGPAWLDQWHR